MVHAGIQAFAVAVVGVFSGTWYYRNKVPSPTDLFNATHPSNIDSTVKQPEVTLFSSPSTMEITAKPNHDDDDTDIWKAEEIAQGPLEEAIRKGKWLLFFNAEWCPHSQAYFSVWKELEELLSRRPSNNHPKLLSLSLSEHPRLAALLRVEKLPSFMMLLDGQVRGYAIASPTLEQLYNLCNANWLALHKPRPLRDFPPGPMIWSIKIFDGIGRICYRWQSRSLNWINQHKLPFYSSLLGSIVLGYYLRVGQFLYRNL